MALAMVAVRRPNHRNAILEARYDPAPIRAELTAPHPVWICVLSSISLIRKKILVALGDSFAGRKVPYGCAGVFAGCDYRRPCQVERRIREVCLISRSLFLKSVSHRRQLRRPLKLCLKSTYGWIRPLQRPRKLTRHWQTQQGNLYGSLKFLVVDRRLRFAG